MLEIAQDRNEQDFEVHIRQMDQFSKKILELEQNANEEIILEKSEEIRDSVRVSLELLTNKRSLIESYLREMVSYLEYINDLRSSGTRNLGELSIISKRIEVLYDLLQVQHSRIDQILSKQTQFEFESILAEEVSTEKTEKDILKLLISQLETQPGFSHILEHPERLIFETDKKKQIIPPKEESNEANFVTSEEDISSSSYIDDEDLSEDNLVSQEHPPNDVIEQISELSSTTTTSDAWSYSGSIYYSQDQKPLGIITEPFVDPDNTIFLRCIKEDELALEKTDQIYREMSMILQGATDSSIARKEVLQHEIAETLGISKQIALKPTFVREYFSKKNIVSLKLPIELDLSIKAIEYYPYDSIKIDDQSGNVLVSKDLALKEFKGSLLPSTWSGTKIENGCTIRRFDNSNLGVVRSILSNSSFGTFLVVESDKPSKDMVNYILQHIEGSSSSFSKRPGIWSLRFLIARRLDGVFEGEALLYWNLWKYIWEEQVPILPWDLRMDYIGMVPAGGVDRIDDSGGFLKRRLDKHTIESAITFPKDAIVYCQGRNLGRFVGFNLDDTGLPQILVAHHSAGEILESVGRERSDDYLRRLGARISKALGVPIEQAMNPNEIARYFLFFVRMIEGANFQEVMNWLQEHFGLLSFPINSIELVTESNIQIQSNQ